MRVPIARIHRVNQLDAIQLDTELVRLIAQEAHTQILRNSPSAALDNIETLIQLVIFVFSIARNRPSPGNALQNLEYSRNLGILRKFLYGVLAVGLPWGWRKWSNYMTSRAYGGFPRYSAEYKVYKASRILEIFARMLSVANFVRFLGGGRYRSIVDRLLGMELVYIEPRMNRQVVFDLINQQLVWHGFSEFLLFFLPLINLHKVRRWIRKLLKITSNLGSSGQKDEEVNRACLICGLNPILVPTIADCQHRFCDYCLRATLLAETNYRCPQCEQLIRSYSREGSI